MEIADFKAIDELSQKCGNKYLAVKFLAKAARKLGEEKKDYHISESKLLQWVLTGQCPYSDAQLEMRFRNANDDGLRHFMLGL